MKTLQFLAGPGTELQFKTLKDSIVKISGLRPDEVSDSEAFALIINVMFCKMSGMPVEIAQVLNTKLMEELQEEMFDDEFDA